MDVFISIATEQLASFVQETTLTDIQRRWKERKRERRKRQSMLQLSAQSPSMEKGLLPLYMRDRRQEDELHSSYVGLVQTLGEGKKGEKE